MQVKAIDLQPGDVIEGVGEVTSVRVDHGQVAVVEPTRRMQGLKPKRMGSLGRARLAALAVEECYRRVASSVTVDTVTRRRQFLPGDMVTVRRKEQDGNDLLSI